MLMTRAYNVIDADGHILEPLDLWDQYIDPGFRDRAPRIVKGDNGKERLVIEEHMVGDSRISIGRIGGVGARQGVVAADTLEYKDGKPGGFDPHARYGCRWHRRRVSVPQPRAVFRRDPRSAARSRGMPRLQSLASRLLQTLSRSAVRRRDVAIAGCRAGDRRNALCQEGAWLQGRLFAAQSLRR